MRPMQTPVSPRLAIFFASLLLLLSPAIGCGADDDSETGAGLVAERATEGDVTTVRNLAGSTWGTPAVLVQDLSIGVFEGAEEYMLGQVRGLWVTGDEVYVVDAQVPAVRVYDHQGTWLRDIGQQGEGPGEFNVPSGLAVLPDGTVVVLDGRNRRLVYFDGDGTPIDTWRAETGFPFRLEVLHDGTLLVRLTLPPEEESSEPTFISRQGIAPLSPDGELGEPKLPPMLGFEYDPLIIREGGGVMMMTGSMLFQPTHSWTVRPDGAIVAGVGDRYRFEIHQPDGPITAVERYWEPIPVHPDEADYQVARIEASVREMAPEWTYDGDPIPPHKPAFSSFTADRDDRIWVTRPGEGARAVDCVEDPRENPGEARRRPCWEAPTILDVFAPDGTYLGEVERPEDLSYSATFIDGEHYWAAVEDEDGLVTVRRFRIQLPADVQTTS